MAAGGETDLFRRSWRGGWFFQRFRDGGDVRRVAATTTGDEADQIHLEKSPRILPMSRVSNQSPLGTAGF